MSKSKKDTLIEDLKKYIAFFEKSNLLSLTIEEKEFKVAFTAFDPVKATTPIDYSPNYISQEKAIEEHKKYGDETVHKVKALILGTYYESSSPEEKPFVKEGDNIKEGDTLCIIESMKVMNQVKSTASGKVTKIFKQNTDKVSKDEVIFHVE